ncbi:MAG: hypothetical protein MJ204_04605 [Bacteroidales bacterium]|nr:hypothetical protein [Bacteroidales bacterium]
MKKLLALFCASIAFFSSCDMGEDGLPGDAYLKLNWSNEEPSYVYTNGAVPANFKWDTYYLTKPGVYTIDFEYEYEHSHSTVVKPYAVDIEIFEIEGEYGRTHGRDGKDADKDVFFDIMLFPDGEIDFTHEIVKRTEEDNARTKSATIEEPIIVSEKSEVNGKYAIKYTIYQLPSYEK